MTAVVGLDLSLRATGMACSDGTTLRLVPPKNVWPVTAAKRHLRSEMDRIAWILDQVGENLTGPLPDEPRFDSPRPDLVVIEHYSRGSSNRREEMGELGGIIRLDLWARNIPYADVSPASLQKFACGDSKKRDKDAVLAAAIRLGCPGNTNDEADSWFLRQMGLYHLGESDVPHTQYRDDAISKVAWPEVSIA